MCVWDLLRVRRLAYAARAGWLNVGEDPGQSRDHGSRCPGHGDEVVLGFDLAGFDEQPVFDAGLEWIGGGALDRRPHAPDGHGVGPLVNGNGIGFGNQVPNWVRILVGFDLADGDDFEGSESELAVEGKKDRIGGQFGLGPAAAAEHAGARGTGAMMNLNIFAGKPVFVEVKREAAEDDGQRDEYPLFPRHEGDELTLTQAGIFEWSGG